MTGGGKQNTGGGKQYTLFSFFWWVVGYLVIAFMISASTSEIIIFASNFLYSPVPEKVSLQISIPLISLRVYKEAWYVLHNFTIPLTLSFPGPTLDRHLHGDGRWPAVHHPNNRLVKNIFLEFLFRFDIHSAKIFNLGKDGQARLGARPRAMGGIGRSLALISRFYPAPRPSRSRRT